VFSEEILTGRRRLTSRAYLTFVAIDTEGRRIPVPPLALETPEEQEKAAEAQARRAERLRAKALLRKTRD
jgi:acyl-CoA hydrolase